MSVKAYKIYLKHTPIGSKNQIPAMSVKPYFDFVTAKKFLNLKKYAATRN